MSLTSAEEALICRYLLGKAAAEEQTQVEERFINDDAYFEELCVVEDELIDDYVCDRLPLTDKERFERCLATSREWQRRVAFSRRLAGARISAPEVPDTRLPLGVGAKAASIPRGWRFIGPWPAYGLVALSCAAFVAIGWLFMETRQLGTELRGLQGDRVRLDRKGQDLAAQLEAQRQHSEDLEGRLRAEQQKGASLEQQLRAAPAARPLVSFILLPGRQRTVGDSPPPPLVVPNGTDVRLQLDLPYGDARGVYRATLQVADTGAQIWSEDLLRAASSGSRLAVSLRVPSQVLPPRGYDLLLRVMNRAGQFEDVASYHFTVVRA